MRYTIPVVPDELEARLAPMPGTKVAEYYRRWTRTGTGPAGAVV